MYVGGRTVTGNAIIEVSNPANRDKVVGRIARATADDLSDAVASARSALGPWRKLGPATRASAIADGLDAIESRRAELALLYCRENGKLVSAAAGEITAMLSRERNTLGYATRLTEENIFPFDRGASKTRYRPFGVVASIVPWNGPVVLGFTQLVSALLVGNTVVVKPPESCPLTVSICLLEMARRLPDGVLNIVPGGRKDVGDAIVDHPSIDKIAFTGSTEAARNIAGRAAATIKDLTLELGGNDPAIILDDAVFDDAMMERLAGSVFKNCGQICLAVKRIYVPASRMEEFLERFCETVDRFVVGDGTAEGVDIGPVHLQSSIARVEALAGNAVDLGGTVRTLGRLHPEADAAKGNFVLPRIVTGVPDHADVVVQEQFAPIVPVLSYTDIDDALARANDTVFGLGGSAWGKDTARAEEIAWALDAGTVWVNHHGTSFLNAQAPYGGIKQSGSSRKSGWEGVLEYAQIQTLTA